METLVRYSREYTLEGGRNPFSLSSSSSFPTSITESSIGQEE